MGFFSKSTPRNILNLIFRINTGLNQLLDELDNNNRKPNPRSRGLLLALKKEVMLLKMA